METTDQNQRVQSTQAHGARAQAATNATSGPADWPPPRMAPPWGQENVDYAQSEEDAHHHTAKADRAAALDLDL